MAKGLCKIVGIEIVIGIVCLGMSSVRAPCHSAFPQAPAKITPQVSAEYGKPLLGSEVNGGRSRVEWRQGKLSVNVERAPLSAVLQEISAQAGIEFLNLDKLHRQVSVHFSNLPLRLGLQVLLGDMDHGMIGEPGDPSTIRIVIFEPAMRESAMATPALEQPVQAIMKDAPQSSLQAEDLGPTTDLPILDQALGDKDQVAKVAAIQALVERGGSEAMDLLLQAFRQSDSALKMMVIANIGSTPDALRLLWEASLDSDASVREAALAAISESAKATPVPEQPVQAITNDAPQSPLQAEDLGPTTDLPILDQALGDKDQVAKVAAIQALVERGGSEAMDLLLQAFRQSDSALKMMVIANIGSTPDALPLLWEATLDSDASVREAALAAIPLYE